MNIKDIIINKKDIIRFDHKYETTEIKKRPTNWLAKNKRTPEKQKIWDSCKFGMLCNKCNLILPTKNRKQFLINAVKYVFGDNAKIV